MSLYELHRLLTASVAESGKSKDRKDPAAELMIDDLPAPAKATIQQESDCGKIVDLLMRQVSTSLS
jgi:hypothetical protein